MTVQDFSYAVYAEITDQAEHVICSQREAVLRADHVICVSKSTEERLLERIPEAAGKTSVIHHGTAFRPNGARKDGGRIRFLYIGARARYKNFALALHAFAKAARSCPEIRMTVAGPPLESHERWQLHLLGVANLVDVEVYPDENRLKHLYCQSTALLYPSQHEGFGHPPLEAMACGAIAVTSNTTSLPEVVGDAGIMLDPASVDDWASCIIAIAKGTLDRTEYVKRGFLRASRFSWDTSFQKHLAIYKRIAQPS
jgi:glycosyltransferase involved in cell wall biosynthesis